MTNTVGRLVTVKQGSKATKGEPDLEVAEFGFSTDLGQEELWIGSNSGNIKVLTQNDVASNLATTGVNNYTHPDTHPASMITGLHSVAISGNYNDLINKPSSIPANGGNADTLGGKSASDFANASHNHSIANITNLQSTLDGKANSNHTHSISQVENLQSTLDSKASSTHKHTISDITGLQDALNNGTINDTKYVFTDGTKAMNYITIGTRKSGTTIGSNSLAQGYNITASGYTSHAEGYCTTSSGHQSHAEGYYTTSSGDYSHAEGYSTTASSKYSHAEGSSTTASGHASHAEGHNTTASGYYSHAEGLQTQANGECAHAEGYKTKSNGNYSHAEGYETKADGLYSHAEGYYTTSSGHQSHAEGANTKAVGNYSHAEGSETTANCIASHAEGCNTTAGGNYSHAEGFYVMAGGQSSHAEGANTTANGNYSHAEGYSTTTSTYASHVSGQYNKNMNGSADSYSSTADAFVIGNGTSYNSLSNAFRVRFNGASYGLSAFNSTGADYAEYFEWLDGNENDEDRVGYVVTLDGDKIRKANEKDLYILGIISSNPSVIGDSYQDDWYKRYVTDEWGRIQHQWVDVEREEPQLPVFNEETGEYEEQEPKKITSKEYHPILSENWNNEKEYIPREQRKEWDAVGLVGKLYVRDDGTCQVNSYAKVISSE